MYLSKLYIYYYLIKFIASFLKLFCVTTALIVFLDLYTSLDNDHRATITSSVPSAWQPHLAAINLQHQHHRLDVTSSLSRADRTHSQTANTEHRGPEESPNRTQGTDQRSKNRKRSQGINSLPQNRHKGHSEDEEDTEPTTNGRHRPRVKKGEIGRRGKSEERKVQQRSKRERETVREEKTQHGFWERENLNLPVPKQTDSQSWERNEETWDRVSGIQNDEKCNKDKLRSRKGDRKNETDRQEINSETECSFDYVWQSKADTKSYDAQSLSGISIAKYCSPSEAQHSPFSFLLSKDVNTDSEVS